jgi:sugar phosphate isomerase/epimerase
MKLSLSEISTEGTPFAENVRAFAAAGFDGIGIWEINQRGDHAAGLALVRDAGLEVANCVPAIPSLLPLGIPGMEGPPDPGERVASICESVRRLAAFDPESVLVLTGPVGQRTEDEARRIVVEGLREVAQAARETGVRLGLEPAHPGQRDSVSFVNSIADALALLDHTGLRDVGIMADTYNLWHEEPRSLARVAERVTGLHVADEPADPDRTDRVLPGEGGTRSAEHIRALLDAGWDGFLDVEIFSTRDRFWGLPVDEAARRAHAAATALLHRHASA